MADNSKTAQTHDERVQQYDEAEDNQQVADAGVPGQIQYPDREVDAERAAGFAAGKYDTLYEDEATLADDEVNRVGIQDDPRNAEQIEHNESEPEELRHEG